MTHSAKTALRFGIYGLTIAYVLCDLFVFDGPFLRFIKQGKHSGTAAVATTADPVVARVAAYNIHRSQLERALQERSWRDGKPLAGLDPQELARMRRAALDDLIDHELLRSKASANAAELKVTDEEITERMERFTAGFPNKEALDSAMASQGITSGQALRERLAAHIQQDKYVESRLAPLIGVTDDEARQWFEQNQGQIATPERIEARHVFRPTLDLNPDEVKQQLVTALAALSAGTKDFGTLVREVSEDPLTKNRGGALGWMTRARLPEDLAGPLFAMPLHQPALLRSKLGWHLIEVTARKPAEAASFEQAKPEILSALEAVKRRQAATEFRAALRGFEARNIEIY
ncbi:MAG: peptidyl-prolyl cis-trans isomerase [Verrucomicrobiota bacterium]